MDSYSLWAAAVILVLGGIGMILTFSRSRTGQLIQEKMAAGTARDALLMLHEIVFDLMAEAQQAAVREIKEAYADGEFTAEEKKRALGRVKDTVVNGAMLLIGARVQAALSADPIVVRQLVAAKVESTLPTVKALTANPLPAPT